MVFTHVVLYRFMNLGHRGSPVRTVLEQTLRDAGADLVRSFQTNGTVLVRADDPHDVVRRAAPVLVESSGYSGSALVRDVPGIAAAIAGDPFAVSRDDRTYRETVTFLDGGEPLPHPLPWTDPRDSVDLVAAPPGYVLAVVRGGPGAGGDPNAAVERLTGGVATTRTLGTVQRMLSAAART